MTDLHPNLHLMSATEAAAAIAAGRLKPSTLAAGCLERIEQREATIGAWTWIDVGRAMERARALDAMAPRSRLHGIPVGVKDVIDTGDMPTEYGSPIHRGHQPRADAACVALVREAGGLVLGKTVTTEFATRHPGKTRNPHNPEHTPGGSSSGSAAAVADGMVPLAFGTQTSSSIIRPAAFCGVVGYKPTYNTLNRAGLKFLSESMDTLGVLTRTVPDAALITEALTGAAPTDFSAAGSLRPRIGFCRTPWWMQADEASRAALEALASRLAAAGARVQDIDLPAPCAPLDRIQVEVSSYEFYRALSWERCTHPALLSSHLTQRLEGGGRITRTQYIEGLAHIERCRTMLDDVFRDVDVLLSPSAKGEAPRGIDATGDPIFGLAWTVLHAPTVTVPVLTGPSGLPLGAQIVGRRGTDAQTLLAADWVVRNAG